MSEITKNDVIKDLNDFKDYIGSLDSEAENWESVHTRLLGIQGRLNAYIMSCPGVANTSRLLRMGNELSRKLEPYTSFAEVPLNLRGDVLDWFNAIEKDFNLKVDRFFLKNWNTGRVKDLLLSTISELKSLD